MKPTISLLYLFSSLLVFAGSAYADASLGSRMKERLPKVLAAKAAGTVGEGVDGLLHIRSGADDTGAELAKAENADRTPYFGLVAKKTEGSASAVAKQWAKAMWSKGKEGHWFRDAKGNWSQK